MVVRNYINWKAAQKCHNGFCESTTSELRSTLGASTLSTYNLVQKTSFAVAIHCRGSSEKVPKRWFHTKILESIRVNPPKPPVIPPITAAILCISRVLRQNVAQVEHCKTFQTLLYIQLRLRMKRTSTEALPQAPLSPASATETNTRSKELMYNQRSAKNQLHGAHHLRLWD